MKGTPGTLIHGTMRDEDLLRAFATELRRLDEAGNYYQLCNEAMVMANDPEGDYQYMPADVITDLFDRLDEFSPEGHRFGAHEGDGSDYGFWPVEVEEDDSTYPEREDDVDEDSLYLEDGPPDDEPDSETPTGPRWVWVTSIVYTDMARDSRFQEVLEDMLYPGEVFWDPNDAKEHVRMVLQEHMNDAVNGTDEEPETVVLPWTFENGQWLSFYEDFDNTAISISHREVK